MPSGPDLFDDQDGVEPDHEMAQPAPRRADELPPVTSSTGGWGGRGGPNYLIRRAVVVGGVVAVATAVLPDDQQRLTLPVAALIPSAGQDVVWVIDKGALSRRTVTVGRRDPSGGRVEVLSGLPADAVVLAARFDNLVEGGKALVMVDKVPGKAVGKADAVASAAASSALQ